jgi:multiple sugar transport system substrate-binding protein
MALAACGDSPTAVPAATTQAAAATTEAQGAATTAAQGAAATTAAAGGTTQAAASALRAYAGTKLRFIRHSAADADWMKAQLPAFKEATGIDVTLELVPYADMHNKLVVEFAAGSGTYDLTTLPDFWLAEFDQGNWLKPLDAYTTDPKFGPDAFNLKDIPESLLGSNRINGKLLGIPWKFNTLTLFYRSDLIAEPPKTWDEWKKMAADQTKNGVYGVGLSLGATTATEEFLDFLYSNNGRLLADDNKTSMFNSPEGVEALEFMVSLIPYAAPGSVSRHYDDSAAIMAQGKIAMEMLIPYHMNTLQDPKKSTVIDKIKTAPFPSKQKSSTKVNTWALGIPAASKNPEAAYLLIQYLESPDNLKKMVTDLKGGIVPSRTSSLTDNAIRTAYPQFVVADSAAKTGFTYPPIPQISVIEQSLAKNIQRAVNKEVSAKEALDAAANEINEQLKK